MSSKKFFYGMLTTLILSLLAIAAFVIMIDPYIQYHKPYEGIHYRLEDERYMNSGIIKNFEYDAVVTGTSMTENFKVSEVDELFSVNAIKVPLEGASYKEINSIIEMALEKNPGVKMVIRAIDGSGMIVDKDMEYYVGDAWPEYLYDDNYLNDVNYVLSAEAIKKAYLNFRRSLEHIPSTTLDDYAYWNHYGKFGKETVFKGYERPEMILESSHLSEEEQNLVLENVRQNVTAIAEEYPDIIFYYFIPPYSIVYWDREYRNGVLEHRIESEKIVIEEMLKYPNIKVFGFSNCLDIITDLDNYKDIAHYSADINSELLVLMYKEKYLLTEDNYEAYIASMYDIFTNYDYDTIFETE